MTESQANYAVKAAPMTPAVLHRRAVTYYRRGTDNRWVACLAASRIVGNYERGATLALAQDLAISASQVENLAYAGMAYRTFRRFGLDSETRRRLTPSHFSVWQLFTRLEIDPAELVSELRTAAENGVSCAGLSKALVEMYGDGKDDETPAERFTQSMQAARSKLIEAVDVAPPLPRPSTFWHWRGKPSQCCGVSQRPRYGAVIFTTTRTIRPGSQSSTLRPASSPWRAQP